MKYIHIVQSHQMSNGGVDSVVTDVSEAMIKQNVEVHVISLFSSSIGEMENEKIWSSKYGVNVLTIQKEKMNVLSILYSLRKKLKILNKEDDICLFLHLKWGVLAGVISSFGLRRITLVEVYHSFYMNYKLQSFICKPFIDKYIAVSKESKEQLTHWFKIRERKINVIYNGIDEKEILAIVKDDVSNRRNDIIRFISIGRLTEQKGFLNSITAFAELKIKGRLDDSLYNIIGAGEQEQFLKKISRGMVEFKGKYSREKVYTHIKNSDVVIIPSLHEGHSILLLEALTIGKAVIVTDIPSFREVLEFKPLKENEEFRLEKFGCVFKKDSTHSCIKAIDSMYQHRDELVNMGECAYEFSKEYTTKKQAIKYIEITSC